MCFLFVPIEGQSLVVSLALVVKSVPFIDFVENNLIYSYFIVKNRITGGKMFTFSAAKSDLFSLCKDLV